MNIIEIENLTHRFSDGSLGIENIDLSVQEGEFIVIAGKNGSGKTTLLKHFNGLLMPEIGFVNVCGLSVSENPARARQMVGMIFQDADSQIVGETVYDDVAFGPENLYLDRSEINRRVLAAIESVGLTTHIHQRPHLLSGGEKRKLAIAGVLAMEPRILVFDEPFSNLDYPGVRQIMKQMISFHQAGRTILLTTHDLEKVIPYADRLIIMKQGKIVRDGSPDSILPEVEHFGVRRPCACQLKSPFLQKYISIEV